MMARELVSSLDPGAMHYRAADTAAGLPGPACHPAYVSEGGNGVTNDPAIVTCQTCYAREAGNILARRALTDTLQGIAANMPGWHVETEHADYGDRAPHLVRDDGVTLWASVITYGSGQGRLRLGAGVPDGASYSDGDTRDPRPEITVDSARPAEKLAADIMRRLVDPAAEYWTTVSSRIAARTARKLSAESLAGALAGIMGGQPWERDGRWRTYTPDGVSGSAETYDGETVSFEIRNVPAKRALELARLLAGWS